MSIRNGHGGARVGAGRKPKALIYASEIAVAEAMMVGALPRVTAKLIALAEAGDVSAIRLFFDRIMGRPAQLEKPLSSDTSIPYVEDDLNRDLMGRFIDSCDIEEMLDRQFEERFRDLSEEDGDDAEAETGADEEETEASPAEKSDAPGVSAAEVDDDVESDEPRYYYVGNEVKFGTPPSSIRSEMRKNSQGYAG